MARSQPFNSEAMFNVLQKNFRNIGRCLSEPNVERVIAVTMFSLDSITLEDLKRIKGDGLALVNEVMNKKTKVPERNLKVITDFVTALRAGGEKGWADEIEKAGYSEARDVKPRQPLSANMRSDDDGASLALDSSKVQLKYERPVGHSGRAVIIYLERYSDDINVPENSTDGRALATFFRERYFRTEVIANEEATKSYITGYLNDVAENKHTDTSMFVCVVLSQGGKTADGRDCVRTYNVREYLLIEEITKPFMKCRGLAGKPKVVIINACIVPQRDEAANNLSEEDNVEQSGVSGFVPLEADFLIFYSCVQGLLSSTTANGSFFVTTLVEMLRENADNDVVTLFTCVIRKLIERAPVLIPERTTGYHHVRTPCLVSTLRKALHFH